MCRLRATTLDPTPRASREARDAVRAATRAWGIDDSDDLQVIASELVTNAVLHARTAIELQLCVAAGVFEVAVGDGATGQPMLRATRLDLLGDLDLVPVAALDVHDRHPSMAVGAAGSVAAGRGLLLVAALADRWGSTARRGGGKHVWAQVPQPVGGPHPAACPCPGSTTHTPGGISVRHIAGPWDMAS